MLQNSPKLSPKKHSELSYQSFLTPGESKKAWKYANSRLNSQNDTLPYTFQSDSEVKKLELLCTEDEGERHVFAFDLDHILGEGGQGTVYLGQELFESKGDNDRDNLVVIKISTDPKCFPDCDNELNILKYLGYHRGSLQLKTKYYVVSDYCQGQNLLNICYKKPADQAQLFKKKLPPFLAIRLFKAI